MGFEVTFSIRLRLVHQSSPTWIDYDDYSGGVDYSDYADYANERVSAYWPKTYDPDTSLAGSSLQHLSEAADLLTARGDIQDAQDHRIDYADGVINRNQRNQSQSALSQASIRDDDVNSVNSRNHRNQSQSAITQVSDHVEPSSTNIDYGDYADATDYGDYD